MSGMLGPNWAEDDAATFGEQVARSRCCNAPLVLVVALTAIIERCGHCSRLEHWQLVYGERWWNEP